MRLRSLATARLTSPSPAEKVACIKLAAKLQSTRAFFCIKFVKFVDYLGYDSVLRFPPQKFYFRNVSDSETLRL